MGTIVGFDLAPFFKLAEVKGYPVALLAELVQAAESGMLEALNKTPALTDRLA